ncbi:MAG: serine hydrolase domain-containing protein [Micropepsaceae bacterium]
MRRFLFLLAVASMATINLCRADDKAPPPPSTHEDLDQRLAKLFKDGGIPGASLALVEDGQITFVKGYGLADKEKATPVTPDTVFRAASISKSLTGIAIMTAVQDGKLSLDGRVKDLAADVAFDNPWEATDPLRLVHLIEHTTGWPDISLRVLTTDGKGWTLMRGVQEASPGYISRWKPGRFSVYNNAGPAVAGVILEKATGQDFNAYMRERVLRPMGMATGDFELTPELSAHLSKSYDADGAETPFQNIILGPAGSLDVTAKELAQLVRFFLGRGTVDGTQVLTPDSVARIERSESTLGARVGFASYGYGLGNTPFPDQGVTFRGHNGGIDSFTSVYGYSLATNSGYVLMANGGDGVDIAQPAAQLVQAYLTRNAQPKNEPTVAVDQAQLEKYAGVYRAITPSNRFTRPYQEILGLTWVQADLGKLRISGNDFFPTSQHTFRRADREAPTLAFTEDQGETYKISAFNATQKEPWWRVAVIAGVLGFLALGAVIAVLMSPVWLIAWLRGRLADRGGALVRILPLLSVVALIVTFALPLGYLTSGAIPAALQLAQPGPYAYTIFASSILFPLFAALGLWRALTASGVGVFVRLHAMLTSLALLAFCAYAASIGWVGAQTWTM